MHYHLQRTRQIDYVAAPVEGVHANGLGEHTGLDLHDLVLNAPLDTFWLSMRANTLVVERVTAWGDGTHLSALGCLAAPRGAP